MAANGGNLWLRAMVLVLVMASSGFALSACEYHDASPAPSDTPAAISRAAPPPAPKADPILADARARNQAQLDTRLSQQPDGVVLGGSGGLANDGFRSSAAGIPKGRYAVGAECVGVLKASLTVSQPDQRGGTSYEVALDCGTTARAKLDLKAGPVSVHIIRMTTEPGLPAVAGFWMAPVQ